jgi:putative endopeptidase
MYKRCLFLGALCLCLFACQQKESAPVDILAAHMDTTVNAGDDFFSYANGKWIKENPIPPDQNSWGIGNLVEEELYLRKRDIVLKAKEERDNGDTGIAAKIAWFWVCGMDSLGIEAEHMDPLKPEMAEINAIDNLEDLARVTADLHKKGVGTIFSDDVEQDAKNSSVMVYSLYQGGLGMPNRDYYFNTDARTSAIRAAYKPYIAQILRLAGYDSAKADQASQEIYDLETKLAGSSRKLEDLRDPYANYNKMAVSKLNGITPSWNWNDWLKNSGINNLDTLIVGQPEFYKEMESLIKSEPLNVWKDYLKFHTISTFANFMSSDFVNASFDFYGKRLSGVEKMKPRWKRVLDEEEGTMGEALGELFVKEYFPEQAKQRYSNLVEAIRTAYAERIKKLTWMSDSTKAKALDKLSRIKKKIGYPDKWKDFTAMNIKRQTYTRNIINANIWWSNWSFNKLGKPVDRDEWDMTPQTYNAYYNPSNNEIVLPAGIFTVPGFKDDQLDDALVYGYAGASTIGHEITHGFDDQGRQFDADGNLKGWWTPKDSAEFAKRAEVMIKQFSSYVVVDTLRINGKATLGENIADLGGVLLGWDAFQKTDEYKKGEKVGGLTPQQRFFLGYALGWLEHERNEVLARQLLTDVHSPAKFRVNGPFADVGAFYNVFNVKPSDKMYIPDSARVQIW